MKSRRYYAVLLRMKGDKFPKMAQRIRWIARLLAVLFPGVAIAGYFFVGDLWGAVILAIACAIAGACGAIDRSTGRRAKAWHLMDQVIDWPLVKEKSKKK